MTSTVQVSPPPPWRDTSLTAAERARELVDAMTPTEKLHQLGSVWPGAEGAGGDVAPMQDTLLRAAPFDEAIRDGIGQITRAFGTSPIAVGEGRARLVGLQHRVVAANRFGIPALAHEECLTGVTAWTASVFPAPIAWAATSDPELVEEMGAAIGRGLRELGVHQGLAPVLDVVRDYRWGRVEETLGEDPTLVADIGAAYVHGLQSAGPVATLKHFAGYSASRGARNHAPVSIGPREFADVILPSFARAILVGGARSVMNSYADIDGLPPAASHALLTELLRDDWGFTGTVVSDYWAIPFLQSTHRVAASIEEAGVMALEAGMDVELPHALGFGDGLLRAVEDGRLDPETFDRAVLRVLTQKIELGLLDPDWTPESDGLPEADLDPAGNREIARRVAEESVVLLANPGGLLPLSAPSSVAVIGPGADDSGCLFGCYSFPNHVLAAHPEFDLGIKAPTILDAIRAEFPGSSVSYDPGTTVMGGETEGIEAAARSAAQAEVSILVVGDRSGMFGHGTSGEGCDVTTLELPGAQGQLADAVLSASPRTVLVVLSGRPYAIGDFAARADATLQVFFPGEEGGPAVAGVISGRVEPSGRLPVQIPAAATNQPGTYLAAPLALRSDGVSNIDPTPAFPFGFGLSYSSLQIDEVVADAAEAPTSGSLQISATVSNTGDRVAWHVPQLYLSDPVASITRPVRRRLSAGRVRLQPGERATVHFDVPCEVLGFTGVDLRYRVEPGELVLTVAQSAADPGRSVSVNLTGPVHHAGLGRYRGVTARVDAASS